MSAYDLRALIDRNSDLFQGASKHSCPICSSQSQNSNLSSERSASQASRFSNSDDINSLLGKNEQNPQQPAKWNVAPGGTITYSFVSAQSAETYAADAGETNIEEVNDRIKENVRQIFRDNYATILPLNFVEVPDSAESNIRIMFSDGPGPDGNAYAYLPGNERGGAIHLQKINEDDLSTAYSQGPGSYGHSTLIHEIGHAMGLKHPVNYNAGSDQTENPGELPYLPFDKDNTRNTIMSYNPGSATSGDPNAQEPASLMPYDIRALQFLYGADTDFNSGNTVYRFDSTNFNTVQTIWDAGGTDTVDFSALLANNIYSLNLNQGEPLTAKSALETLTYKLETSQVPPGADPDRLFRTDTFGTYIAFGTSIENLVGSPGDDEASGNDLVNSILGGAGNDTITGLRQSDNLDGGEGDDFIYGGKGLDVVTGGGGDDLISGGRGNDTIVSGLGRDRIILEPDGGTETIVDFTDSLDVFVLNDGLRFEQLSIAPLGNATAIGIRNTGQVLALLPGVVLSSIGQSDFAIA